MTQRTTANESTPIERATADTVASIRHNAEHFHHEHACTNQMPLRDYMRMLVLYLHDKSLKDWCADLGIDPSQVDGHE